MWRFSRGPLPSLMSRRGYVSFVGLCFYDARDTLLPIAFMVAIIARLIKKAVVGKLDC